MNIQLFLDNQEVELGEDIVIPLNKTYSNLYSPTEIIIDYSKDIQIPVTQTNNRILGNAYRLDRRIIEGETNIGYHLFPPKRIPAKLLYNGKIVLDGYAKFVSASYSNTSKHYNITLFGAIGDVIKKLMNVVTSPSLLSEGLSQDYVLNDNLSGKYLDSVYVYNSWMNVNNKTGSDVSDYDIIGFAPSHRGLYPDFSSDKVEHVNYLTNPVKHSLKPISEILENTWKSINPDNTFSASEIVGEGLPDYRVRDFRTYMMKPYIYINQLFRMYQDQCKKLSDYEITLDEDWFNDANPYWSKMCYMLDFLDSKGSNSDSTTPILSGTTSPAFEGTSTNYSRANWYLSEVIDVSKLNGICVATRPIEIQLEGNNTSSIPGEFELVDGAVIKINAQIVTGGSGNGTTAETKNFYYWTGVNASTPGGEYTDDNYIQCSVAKGVDVMKYKTIYSVTIPGLGFDDIIEDYVAIFIHVDVENNNSANGLWKFTTSTSTTTIQPSVGSPNFTMSSTVNLITSWKNSTKVKLSELYFSEEPLFKAIIQYTKMFGLLWDIDYDKKIINILHRSKYFKNYRIENWSNIIDRNKDLLIEPNTIGSKYMKLNYEELEGYRYTGYRDKYGVGYGEVLLSSNYEFDTDTKELFDEVNPSSSSCKTYVPLPYLSTWNGKGILLETVEDVKLIDAESEDEKSSISVNNWYLRGDNVIVDWPAFITTDSSLMLTSNESCYYFDIFANPKNIHSYSMPTFDIAINFNGGYYGGLFGTPKEDYTGDKLPTKAKNNYIYDLFWKDYMSGVYGHNKKVTAYFFIDPDKYQQFNFNTLIALDNQVFLVNKITDFNINSSTSTKCELVQINNIENLHNSYSFEIGEGSDTPAPPLSTYTVTITGALQCTLDCPSTVKEGETFVCTIRPKDSLGNIYLDGCKITMGGTTLSPSAYINTTAKILTIPNVTGDITLEISCTSVGDGSGGGNNNGPTIGGVILRPGMGLVL